MPIVNHPLVIGCENKLYLASCICWYQFILILHIHLGTYLSTFDYLKNKDSHVKTASIILQMIGKLQVAKFCLGVCSSYRRPIVFCWKEQVSQSKQALDGSQGYTEKLRIYIYSLYREKKLNFVGKYSYEIYIEIFKQCIRVPLLTFMDNIGIMVFC